MCAGITVDPVRRTVRVLPGSQRCLSTSKQRTVRHEVNKKFPSLGVLAGEKAWSRRLLAPTGARV
eukprot:3164750-Amphidinium_carterae.1